MVMAELVLDNPFTGEPSARRPLLNTDAVDPLLDAATHCATNWRRRDVSERVALCERVIEAMLADETRIVADITAMMGKPRGQAVKELHAMVERARHMIAIAPDALTTRVLADKPGVERRIERVPLGVVFNMPAWNYPLLTCVNVVVPAVLAGNALVLKHSTRSALCGEHFADAFIAAGAPEGLVTAIHCDHAMAATIAADPRVGYVAFTGSVGGGRAVYRAVASNNFADVGLELGGKDAAYIAADADVARAVDGVVDGACYNAGQSCCGVERVYAHASIYDDVVAGARAAIAAMRLGDPRQDVDMGPMAQPASPAFLAEQCAAAKQAGAEVLEGGSATKIDGRGRFFQPTLLVAVNHDMAVMQEESFGPILPIMKVGGDDEALSLMNDSELGLTASLWTRDRERAARMARELEVGTVYMNACDVLDPGLPWTGVKNTGKGSTLSDLGFLHLTRPRSWLFRE
jgi:acyl-CoA reductase-like NAD-dependent aldehyde dehydrogenase